VTLQALVAAAEDLMENKHPAWIGRMTKTNPTSACAAGRWAKTSEN
jgi:hypothetical protein